MITSVRRVASHSIPRPENMQGLHPQSLTDMAIWLHPGWRAWNPGTWDEIHPGPFPNYRCYSMSKIPQYIIWSLFHEYECQVGCWPQENSDKHSGVQVHLRFCRLGWFGGLNEKGPSGQGTFYLCLEFMAVSETSLPQILTVCHQRLGFTQRSFSNYLFLWMLLQGSITTVQKLKTQVPR